MRSAILIPEEAGVAVTEMVHAASRARGVVQPLDCSKSGALVPVISIVLTVRRALPIFIIVTTLGADVMFKSITPKLMDRGFTGFTAIFGRFRKIPVIWALPVMVTTQVLTTE